RQFPPDDAVQDILSRTDFLQVLPHFRFTGEVPSGFSPEPRQQTTEG
ncbi:transcriptional regulator, partial [Salmonella enterica]|nr:transcriptional regulator [Salmonella enterica]ECH3817679.1 transcriptional regulator [Salmonella enterica]EDD5838031.1 transcriptional regulator [Salmonella enterica subsp. enterica serovar Enteritidis]